ncbi:MAG: SUMF1/EgtB/PvdO family nonheme iron enzyme [Cyanobacteria bacterium P01_H01_bin.15]
MAEIATKLSLPRFRRTNKSLVLDLGEGVSLTLMQIPAGEFLMGAPESEPESRDNERPVHRVEFKESFLLGRYPVTQAQ